MIDAGDLTVQIDSSGRIVALKNNAVSPHVDHSVSAHRDNALLSLTVEPSISSPTRSTASHYLPEAWGYLADAAGVGEYARGRYVFNFIDGISVVVEAVEKREGYATLEVVEIDNPARRDIRNVLWGPLVSDIVALVGDYVGVVSTRDFAMGMLGANAKTTGGWPSEYSGIGYRANVVGGADHAGEFGRNGRFWYETSAARTLTFGSVIQAYTRDYSVERVFEPWNWLNFKVKKPVPALTGELADYGTLKGSKVILLGVARKADPTGFRSKRDALAEQVLTRIGEIEIGEGLPHPVVDGVWIKRSEKPTTPYLILTDLGSANLGRICGNGRIVRHANRVQECRMGRNCGRWGLPGHRKFRTLRQRVKRPRREH